MHPALRSHARNVFGVQLTKIIHARYFLSIVNSDCLQHARSVHRVYESGINMTIVQ